MIDSESFAFILYLPDATLAALRDENKLSRLLRDGVPELDFLCPGWWESAHTVRLALARPGPLNE